MPDQIPQHYSTEFSTNWIHRVQQTAGRLDPFVEDDAFDGERKRYDRIGAQNSRKRTERKGPTNIIDPALDHRWAYRASFDIGNLLDQDDARNLGPLVVPTSDYVRSHANAYHRDSDDIAWQAALDDALTGELGNTPSPLPAGQKIAVGSPGSDGLTLAKLITANQILEDADLEDEQPRVLCVTARQLSDLLNTTEIKSADYNTVKALVNGTIDTFMGFKFVKIKRLRKSVGNVRTLVGWVKGAIKRIKGPMNSDVSMRKDLSMATQIYSSWNLGAVRIYDEGVVQIDVQE